MKKFHKLFQARIIRVIRKKNKESINCLKYWNTVNKVMLKDEGMYDTEETKKEIQDLIVRNNRLLKMYIRDDSMKDSKVFKNYWKIDRSRDWKNQIIQYKD